LEEPGAEAVSPPPPTVARIESDVTYCTNDGVGLQLDLVYPVSPISEPAPLIVYVHGGGWRSGDKAGSWDRSYVAALIARGFVIASVNYRLAPDHPFPAQIVDVKCAVRFLRAHADQYGLSTTKIGALGGSAGGHLVALLGVTDSSDGFDVGEYADESSQVSAVVDIAGPSDIADEEFRTQHQATMREEFLDSIDLMTQASPVTYVSTDDASFLIFHSDDDRTVPVSQSETFDQALQAEGLESTLTIVPGGGHLLESPRIRRREQVVDDPIFAFLERHLL